MIAPLSFVDAGPRLALRIGWPSMLLAVWVAAAPGAAVAQSSSPNRITVPLSDPARPATVRVALLTGSIKVTGHSGKEVIVATRSRDVDEDEDHEGHSDSKSRGLRRVPNLASGLTIEEYDNVVQIGADSWNNPTDVVLQVPIGTSLELNTVNDGDILVENVQGEVSAENTNGNVTITGLLGSAVIHALNGEIVARITRLDSKKASSFSSMNGNIDVTLPPDARAEVRVKSDNGEIFTDFDVQWGTKAESMDDEEKAKNRKKKRYGFETSMVGVLNGSGGPTLRFQTFNGNIYIRKSTR